MKDNLDFNHNIKLKWDPYIGKDYFKNKTRVLIIGESHYKKDDDIEKYENKNFTKSVIKNHAIKEKYSKLFPNLHKALFDKLVFDKQQLWNNLAFYNFVQRSMETNKKRPTKDDFIKGWKTFFKVIVVLKPTHCLFVGVGASKWLKKVHPAEIIKKHNDKINNTYPRKLNLKINNTSPIKVIFIKHSSQYFSWPEWNAYLEKEMEEELFWLRQKLN